MKIRLDDELPEQEQFQAGDSAGSGPGFSVEQESDRDCFEKCPALYSGAAPSVLLPEFLEELKSRGRIYGYRYRPHGQLKARPIDEYEGKCLAGKAFQLMIDNNLDFDVALYPYELVTYGETGSVCQNWMQLRLIKKYLQVMTENQTLVMQSGHPLGPFPLQPGQSAGNHYQRVDGRPLR